MSGVLVRIAWWIGFLHGMMGKRRTPLMWHVILLRVAWFVLIVAAVTMVLALLNH